MFLGTAEAAHSWLENLMFDYDESVN